MHYSEVVGTTRLDSRGDVNYGVIWLYTYKSGKKVMLYGGVM